MSIKKFLSFAILSLGFLNFKMEAMNSLPPAPSPLQVEFSGTYGGDERFLNSIGLLSVGENNYYFIFVDQPVTVSYGNKTTSGTVYLVVSKSFNYLKDLIEHNLTSGFNFKLNISNNIMYRDEKEKPCIDLLATLIRSDLNNNLSDSCKNNICEQVKNKIGKNSINFVQITTTGKSLLDLSDLKDQKNNLLVCQVLTKKINSKNWCKNIRIVGKNLKFQNLKQRVKY